MTKDQVIKVLLTAVNKDQALRKRIMDEGESDSLWDEVETGDRQNSKVIKNIVLENGLISIPKYGKDAATAAFLLVQHMPEEDLHFMEEYLKMMKAHIEEISKEYLALLQDRVLTYSGKKQRYGTQVRYNESTGQYDLLPLEDPENVDIRRAELGLDPLQEYLDYYNS